MFIFGLLAFSYLNFKKVDIRNKEQFGTTDTRIVTIRRTFSCILILLTCISALELVISSGILFVWWVPHP
jgi:hypothetical protein